MSYTAIIQEQEGVFVAECLEVGAVSLGNTIDEAVERLKKATQKYLEEFPLEKHTDIVVASFELEECDL